MPPAVPDIGAGTWALAVACGALCGLDATSWPQVMISRPIVSATVGGLLLGDPAAGFLAGAVLELLSLRHPPYGAARYPDAGPAGIVAGAAHASAAGGGPLPLLAAALGGWAAGWLGFTSVHLLRRLNARLVGDAAEISSSPGRLVRLHRWAIRLDGLRAALITAAFLLPVSFGARLAGTFAESEGVAGAILLTALGLGAAAGAGGRSLGAGTRAWPLVGVGALLAFLVVS